MGESPTNVMCKHNLLIVYLSNVITKLGLNKKLLQIRERMIINNITDLVNSITAACSPKQTPRKGFLVLRHQVQAASLPSKPLLPNPPGTITPLINKYKLFLI